MMNKPLDQQMPHPKLLTSRDKYENSYWMEQLPAHVWVQNEDNTVVYSNRLPVKQMTLKGGRYCRARKISCCRDFMDEKSACPCCPYQRITSTLRPESCLCRKDEEIYQVYHFPFVPNNGYHWEHPPFVMKIEINLSAIHFRGKRRDYELVSSGEKSAKASQAEELVKICSTCKKVKDSSGSWSQLENYFSSTRNIKFSHGMCGECACRLYPGIMTGMAP